MSTWPYQVRQALAVFTHRQSTYRASYVVPRSRARESAAVRWCPRPRLLSALRSRGLIADRVEVEGSLRETTRDDLAVPLLDLDADSTGAGIAGGDERAAAAGERVEQDARCERLVNPAHDAHGDR